MTMLAINWGNALLITGVGFGLVFVVLVLLIFIVKSFGVIFAQKPKAQAAVADPDLNTNDCYRYAALRNALYRKGKEIELMVSVEPRLCFSTQVIHRLPPTRRLWSPSLNRTCGCVHLLSGHHLSRSRALS